MVTVCIFFGWGGGPEGAADAFAGGLDCAGSAETGSAIAGEAGQSGLAEGADPGAVAGAVEPGIGVTDATTDGGNAAL